MHDTIEIGSAGGHLHIVTGLVADDGSGAADGTVQESWAFTGFSSLTEALRGLSVPCRGRWPLIWLAAGWDGTETGRVTEAVHRSGTTFG